MECPALFPPTQQQSPSHPSSSSKQLHNPYEGRSECAKQLSESPDAFLARLPPSTTDLSPDVPWIYVANPFIPRHQSQGSQEEEAPAEAGTQLAGFMQGGRERLELLGDFVRTIETKMGKGGVKGAAVTRQITKEREDAVADVLMLARMLKVRTGKVLSPLPLTPFLLLPRSLTKEQIKWMLFVPPAHVDQVWSAVVRATLKNELGIAAKVAPRPERGSTKERLICVYTYDFGDREDVARVLTRLRELELVRTGPGAQWIYYKTGKCSFVLFLRRERAERRDGRWSVY